MSLSARTSSWSVASSCALVVGTVHSQSSLRAAQALRALPAAPDLLELRVDHFADHPARLDGLAAATARALIITVRCAGEGGPGDLGIRSRQILYERFLPVAHSIDLELSSLESLRSVAHQARLTPGGLIASYHDFSGFPGREQLHALAGRALAAGAALFKLAAQVEHPWQLTAMLDFLATETRLPLAVMGMGRLGKISRLAAATVGSRLNYGYLGDAPQVPGQWPATVLRARIDELCQSAALKSAPAPLGRSE